MTTRPMSLTQLVDAFRRILEPATSPTLNPRLYDVKVEFILNKDPKKTLRERVIQVHAYSARDAIFQVKHRAHHSRHGSYNEPPYDDVLLGGHQMCWTDHFRVAGVTPSGTPFIPIEDPMAAQLRRTKTGGTA